VGDTGSLTTDASFVGYVIEEVAGRGGMGIVYRAREKLPDRTVALKVISPQFATHPEFGARFMRESNLAAPIEHPNVLPIFRAGDEDGLLYLVMRYVEGTDLAALIADRGRVDPSHAVEIIAAICDALDAAHARGLVHRDVKPANVLIARQGVKAHVYLTDFGIAKRADATGGPTITGSFMGTLDYAAPEQIRSGHVDARTDVDGAAARIFAHLTAAPPFLESTRGRSGLSAAATRRQTKRRFRTQGDVLGDLMPYPLSDGITVALKGRSETPAMQCRVLAPVRNADGPWYR
jgi:serine/threonine protein kinase